MVDGAPAKLDIHEARAGPEVWLADLNLQVAQLGADSLIKGMAADVLQVGIFGQPFKVAITHAQRAFESASGLRRPVDERIAARQVVKDEGIVGTELGELFVDFETVCDNDRAACNHRPGSAALRRSADPV